MADLNTLSDNMAASFGRAAPTAISGAAYVGGMGMAVGGIFGLAKGGGLKSLFGLLVAGAVLAAPAVAGAAQHSIDGGSSVAPAAQSIGSFDIGGFDF